MFLRAYRIVVEGVFVMLPAEKSKFGFFTTLHVAAPSAIDAKLVAKSLLEKRLAAQQINECADGLFATRYLISDIWEIDLLTHKKCSGSDEGFIFHPINGLDRVVAILRNYWVLVFRPHLFISGAIGIRTKGSE